MHTDTNTMDVRCGISGTKIKQKNRRDEANEREITMWTWCNLVCYYSKEVRPFVQTFSFEYRRFVIFDDILLFFSRFFPFHIKFYCNFSLFLSYCFLAFKSVSQSQSLLYIRIISFFFSNSSFRFTCCCFFSVLCRWLQSKSNEFPSIILHSDRHDAYFWLLLLLLLYLRVYEFAWAQLVRCVCVCVSTLIISPSIFKDWLLTYVWCDGLRVCIRLPLLLVDNTEIWLLNRWFIVLLTS